MSSSSSTRGVGNPSYLQPVAYSPSPDERYSSQSRSSPGTSAYGIAPTRSSSNPDDALITQYDTGTKRGDLKILEIIDNGISRIVAEIKSTRLGKSNLDVTTNADAIINALTALQDEIDYNIHNNELLVNRNADELYFKLEDKESLLDRYAYDARLEQSAFSSDTSRDKKTMFQTIGKTELRTLDTDTRSNPLNTSEYLQPLTLDEQNDPNKTKARTDLLQNRLNNCYTLELLYMKKHEEVLKLFAFGVNLFEKYSYAVKVILYLLKNLVYKKTDPAGIQIEYQKGDIEYKEGKGCPEVKIPRTLIKRIDLMVEDQKNMEGIISDLDKKLKTDLNFKKVEPILTGPMGAAGAGAGAGTRAGAGNTYGRPIVENIYGDGYREANARGNSIYNEIAFVNPLYKQILEYIKTRDDDELSSIGIAHSDIVDEQIKTDIYTNLEKNINSINNSTSNQEYQNYDTLFKELGKTNTKYNDLYNDLLIKLKKKFDTYKPAGPAIPTTPRPKGRYNLLDKPKIDTNIEIQINNYISSVSPLDITKSHEYYETLDENQKQQFKNFVAWKINHDDKLPKTTNITTKLDKLELLSKL